MKIVDKYYNALKLIKKINVNFTIEKTLKNVDMIKQNIQGPFVDLTVIDDIAKLKNSYKITFENNVIFMDMNDEINRKYIENLLKIMVYLRKKSKITKPIKMFVYMYEKSKCFMDDYFGPENINSGYTNYDKIVVWRKEDSYKVMIHEMIHFLELDKNFYFGDVNKYKKICRNKDNILEAFTDFIAIHYYIVMIGLLNNSSKQDFFNLLNQEYTHTFNLANNVAIRSKMKTQLINNKTNVYSYYILKNYLFMKYKNKKLREIKNIQKLINDSYNFNYSLQNNSDKLNMVNYQLDAS